MIVRKNGNVVAQGAPPRIGIAGDGKITLTAGAHAVEISRGEVKVLRTFFEAYLDEVEKALRLARLN